MPKAGIGIVIALLVLFGIGALVLTSSKFVQQAALGDMDCVNPDWNTLQCTRDEAGRTKSFIAPTEPNTVDIPCGIDELLSSTDFCDVALTKSTVGSADDGIVYYTLCSIDKDKTFSCPDPGVANRNAKQVQFDDEQFSSGESNVFIGRVQNGQGMRIVNCEGFIWGSNRECKFARTTQPFVLKYNDPVSVANDQNCDLSGSNKDSLVKRVGDVLIGEAETARNAGKLIPGQSIPVVSSLNRGFCDNVVEHPQYGTVICTGNKLYKQKTMQFVNGQLVSLSEDGTGIPGGEYVRGIGSFVAGVKCCPQHDAFCDPVRFEPRTPPEEVECDGDIDCPGAGDLLPLTDTCGNRYSCVSGKCAAQKQECFECLNSVACPDNQVCDSVSHKCIDKRGGEWCGNGQCAATENEKSCPQDCGIVLPPDYGRVALLVAIAMIGGILVTVVIVKLMGGKRGAPRRRSRPRAVRMGGKYGFA